MKVFTVYQPYAYAIVAGLKQYETRPRRTNIRGRVAVHAGKQVVAESGWNNAMILRAGMAGAVIHYSAVVGIVEIVDCVPVEEIADTLTERERLLGDFSPGRFAWVLKNPVMFDEPFPARGQQGWWDWNEVEACRERIEKATYQLGLNFLNGKTPGSAHITPEELTARAAEMLKGLNTAGEIEVDEIAHIITLGNISLDVLPLLPAVFEEIPDRGEYRVQQNGKEIGTVIYLGRAEQEPGKVVIGAETRFIPTEKLRSVVMPIIYDGK